MRERDNYTESLLGTVTEREGGSEKPKRTTEFLGSNSRIYSPKITIKIRNTRWDSS